MSIQDFSRSKALNNIPNRKLEEILSSLDKESADENYMLKKIAFNKFAESNIPVEYWFLKMDKDFFGDTRLLDKYNEYTGDIKLSYINGESICFAGSHGTGKQLCLETELPTPAGFIKLKDLKEGDVLFDENGNTCNVTKLHPINISPESYRILFDDGSTVDACADHLWSTFTRKDRVNGFPSKIRSTKEIFNSLHFKSGIRQAANHSIKCAKPINYEEKQYELEPYVLGCWLGDGNTADGVIECADSEILDNIKLCGFSINLKKSSVSSKSKSYAYRIGDLLKKEGFHNKIGELTYKLKKINVLYNKHIPNEYLLGSFEQRLSLLQGLLDTDGSCNVDGGIEYCTVLPNLAKQVQDLILSLGIKCNVIQSESWLYGKRCKDRYRITFTTKLPVFKLSRKLKNIRLQKNQLSRSEHRFIINVTPITSKPMRCITVDSQSHLFLITRSYISTHNTMVASCILKKTVLKGYSSLYTTLSDVVNVLTQGPYEERFDAKKELVMVDFLVLDEFDPRFIGSENAADLYARSLEGVFRTRAQNKLPTIMCTNSPNVVGSFSGSLKQSIESLMKGYMKPFIVMGNDFRKTKG